MDDEHTSPCPQCSAIDWGISDEGQFYCRCCHTLIQRTRAEPDPSSFLAPGSSRVSSISRKSRSSRAEDSGPQWNLCEGFQFILLQQINKLITLGVQQLIQDQVLFQIWRLYLQKSRQAFTFNPRSSAHPLRNLDSDLDSVVDSVVSTDGESVLSGAGSGSEWSQVSGCSDGSAPLGSGGRRKLRSLGVMSMRKTLALLHLSLLWIKEPLTLGDLLRLVQEGHIPYIKAYNDLPEEMKGKEAQIFKVHTVPSREALHREAQALLHYLQLKTFPPISSQEALHPALLSLRYLMDANLPDELHPWVCRLIDLLDPSLFNVGPDLPQHDLQAGALIIVTMKLLFGFDDCTEWDMSNDPRVQDNPETVFNMRCWYQLLDRALSRGQQRANCHTARNPWRSGRPLYRNKKMKAVQMKRKRTAEQVQLCFQNLSSGPVEVQSNHQPSSFKFCWGDQDGTDGPSLHHMKLSPAVTRNPDAPVASNANYWLLVPKACDPRKCPCHFQEVEERLPRSFLWLLRLFGFLLDATLDLLYQEVLNMERRLFKSRPQTRTRTDAKTRSET